MSVYDYSRRGDKAYCRLTYTIQNVPANIVVHCSFSQCLCKAFYVPAARSRFHPTLFHEFVSGSFSTACNNKNNWNYFPPLFAHPLFCIAFGFRKRKKNPFNAVYLKFVHIQLSFFFHAKHPFDMGCESGCTATFFQKRWKFSREFCFSAFSSSMQ